MKINDRHAEEDAKLPVDKRKLKFLKRPAGELSKSHSRKRRFAIVSVFFFFFFICLIQFHSTTT
jgi:hypothetical protein